MANEIRTNVWVRRSLLTSSLSQKSKYGSTIPVRRTASSLSAASTTTPGKQPPNGGGAVRHAAEDLYRDDDSGTTSVTEALSSMASVSSEWGWVKACMIPSSGGDVVVSVDQPQPQNADTGSGSGRGVLPPLHAGGGGVSVLVTDNESEFDGKTVKIPPHLLGNGGGGQSSSSSQSGGGINDGQQQHVVLGDGIVMANSWANFSTVPAPQFPHFEFADGPAADSSRAADKTNNNKPSGRSRDPLQMSAGTLEVPPEDLIHLTHLHEPAVVYCLRYRYSLDEIYTATGPILLALNPFKDCRKSLYSESLMRKYWERGEGASIAAVAVAVGKPSSGKGTKKQQADPKKASYVDEDLPPHVYAVADNAYRAMMRTLDDQRGRKSSAELVTESANQSILVSGESGAGKTVSAKFLMQYLAALSKRSAAKIVKAKEDDVPVLAKPQSFNSDSSSSGARGLSSPRGHFGTAVPQPELDASSTQSPHNGGRSSNIEQQVLQSNPILESFGNARTIRNDNSSRFGKFIEINFSEVGTLVGASIETYLLEKVRLISQANGERNYHIFYELLGGMSSSEQKKLMIDFASPEDFVMTRSASGTYYRRDGVHDEQTFRELKFAMNTMGFDPEEQLDIFEIVAALLHLSNLTFAERTHEECMLDETNTSLEASLELLGVSIDALEAALCSVAIEAGGERLKKMLGMAQCTKALEALIKVTYSALFEYLVKRVNGCIAGNVFARDTSDTPSTPNSQAMQQSQAAAFIGVLDIFGFESFDTNSFEQLCINYCNESLQQQFNKFVFKLEQAEYEREGIQWKFIDFPDNQNILDLIDKRHTGILSVLDEQCILASCNDQTFASSIYDKHGGKDQNSATFSSCNRQKVRGMFSINHYAGPVEYNSKGFLEKNKDEVPKEINELLAGSENHFLQHLGELMQSRPAVDRNGTSGRKRIGAFHHHKQSSILRISVGAQFCSQLKQLRTRIDATAPHYIRCLKPNDELRPDHFDCAVIADQLRCAGILEAIRVSRVGYPQRYLHERFLSRYQILAVNELRARRQQGKPSSHGSGDNVSVECKILVDVIARKIWALKNNVVLEGDENPFSLPHTRGKRPERRSSSTPRIRRAPTPTRSRNYSTPQTPSASIRNESMERYRANATPPPWASHKLRSATPVSTQSATPASTPPRHPTSATQNPTSVKSQIMATKPKVPTSVPKKQMPKPKPMQPPAKIDLVEVGIQLGKTKVFLRQPAFDAMERMRNRLKSIAATMINALARTYLCRIAYVPVRDAYREEQDEQDSFYLEQDEELQRSISRPRCQTPLALIEKFENKHVGAKPKKKKKKKKRIFKWLLVEGRWARNVNFDNELPLQQTISP